MNLCFLLALTYCGLFSCCLVIFDSELILLDLWKCWGPKSELLTPKEFFVWFLQDSDDWSSPIDSQSLLEFAFCTLQWAQDIGVDLVLYSPYHSCLAFSLLLLSLDSGGFLCSLQATLKMNLCLGSKRFVAGGPSEGRLCREAGSSIMWTQMDTETRYTHAEANIACILPFKDSRYEKENISKLSLSLLTYMYVYVHILHFYNRKVRDEWRANTQSRYNTSFRDWSWCSGWSKQH